MENFTTIATLKEETFAVLLESGIFIFCGHKLSRMISFENFCAHKLQRVVSFEKIDIEKENFFFVIRLITREITTITFITLSSMSISLEQKCI